MVPIEKEGEGEKAKERERERERIGEIERGKEGGVVPSKNDITTLLCGTDRER